MNISNVNVVVHKPRVGLRVYSISTVGLTLLDLHTLTVRQLETTYKDCYLRDITLEQIDYEYFVYCTPEGSNLHVKNYDECDCDPYEEPSVVSYVGVPFRDLLMFVDERSTYNNLSDCLFSHALQCAVARNWTS